MTVTAIPSATITGAAYSGTTGYATFTAVTPTVLVPGSEFTVSGVTPTAYNQAYVAVAGTSASQVVGAPLTGPGGLPNPFGSAPGAGTGGSLSSVITPGMEVAGLSAQVIVMPYTAGGTTGTGGLGTYTLSSAPSSVSGASLGAYGGFYYNGTVARTQVSIGDLVPSFGSNWIGSLGNLAMLWGKIPTQAGGAPSTSDLASICTKQTDIATYAGANGITVHSLYRLNDLGIWGDSGVADFTGSIAGTALTVGSTQFGSLPTVAGGVPSITISGAGITGCPATCPTISSGSGSSYTLSANVGTVTSEPMKAGAFKPAVPNAASTFKGYIDTTAGVSTLHVTSFDDGTAHAGYSSFTGSYDPVANTLTAGGTIVGSVPTPSVVEGASITGAPILLTQFLSGPPYLYRSAFSYYPAFTNDATMWLTTGSIVTGGYIFNSAIVNPVKILSYSGACGIAGAYNGLLGCYTCRGFRIRLVWWACPLHPSYSRGIRLRMEGRLRQDQH